MLKLHNGNSRCHMRLNQDNNSNTKRYLRFLLQQRGTDFTKCNLCGKSLKKSILHHKKYDNATLSDVTIVCYSCNNKKVNRQLV